MPSLQIVTAFAPAKLNLALSVGPPDPSHRGMHPISSWMMTVDLCDELTLRRLAPGTLSRYAILWHKDARRRSEINWPLAQDLAVRAHQALERAIGKPHALPVQMKLEKRIPVAGGLGGGSSDAAAMLRALNQLFNLQFSLDDLAAIAREIGSDVPFLVHGGSAVVRGFGGEIELLDPARSRPLHAVVAFPDCACATREVYRCFDERAGANLRDHEVAALASMFPIQHERLFNDLAAPAMLAAPSLRDDLAALSSLADRQAHVSGSGSSLFVICDDEMHAMALADGVERKLSLPAVAVRAFNPRIQT